VTALGFLPGGKELVSASAGGICVWEAGTGKLLRRVAAPEVVDRFRGRLGAGSWPCRPTASA
jgi:hypothetical protein